MFWDIFKFALAIAFALAIYLAGAFVVRSFMHPPPAEPDPTAIRKVHYRYRCGVCGTEVTMTAAPEGEVPDAPRHCREDMNLVVERGEW
ncbi:MAG: hypothetical protein M3357_02110 [Actinomycetota bacterium]|nr:hypothetical protein [Actinomycetota bacterium]